MTAEDGSTGASLSIPASHLWGHLCTHLAKIPTEEEEEEEKPKGKLP